LAAGVVELTAELMVLTVVLVVEVAIGVLRVAMLMLEQVAGVWAALALLDKVVTVVQVITVMEDR
jgi:hypothetical protein